MIAMNDLYWVAGFLEGEGCFMALNQRRKWQKVTYPYYVPVIDVAQVNLEPLKKLNSLFNGGIFRLVKPVGNCQQAHAWRLNGRKAIALMMTLWPLMSERRRKQIELAIERWKSNEGFEGSRWVSSRSRGEANGLSKLTETNVRAILTSSEATKTLADRYGVSSLSIRNVRNRKTWVHVSDNRAVA